MRGFFSSIPNSAAMFFALFTVTTFVFKMGLENEVTFLTVFSSSKCPKKNFFFFSSRNSGNTHHCQSFSQFSPNSFSSLFSLILPVTYGFTDYYYQCPLEMQNGRCQSEISNGWRERKKKEWRATFHADDACTAVNLKQQFFFPSYLLLPHLCALFL